MNESIAESRKCLLKININYKYETYFYCNYGVFLRGDEGAGFNLGFAKEILDCEPKISYQ